MNHCQSTTKAGNPCRATPQAGKPYCLVHDPARKELQRRQARVGGHVKAAKAGKKAPKSNKLAQQGEIKLKTRAEVLNDITWALEQAKRGEISQSMAASISSLAKTLLREGAVDDGPEENDIGELKKLPASDLEAEMLAALSTEAIRAELKRRSEQAA